MAKSLHHITTLQTLKIALLALLTPLFCTTARGAADGVTITSVSELSSDKAYILYNEHFTTYAIYNPTYSETYMWSAGTIGDDSHTLYSETYSEAFDATSANSAWMIVSKNDQWYLYNIGAKKFARIGQESNSTASAAFIEETATAIEITETDGGFAFRTDTANYRNYMCVAPQNTSHPIGAWSIDDSGAVWQITEADQVEATPYEEVLALIPSYGTLTIDTRNCNIYSTTSGGALPNTVQTGQSFSFACHALDGYEPVDGVIVRHGQNLDGPQYVDGVRQWSEYTLSVENKKLIEIEADSVDGDILLTSYWQCTDTTAYRPMFCDEFNVDGQPDSTYWMRTPRVTAVWNRWCSDSEEVVYQEDGVLHCRAIPNPDTSTDDVAMLTGGIQSQGGFYFQYGRAEARIKTYQWSGNFPAFWMKRNVAVDGWPIDGEIDIWETIDATTNSYHTIHTNWTKNLGNGGNSQTKSGLDYDLWHVFAIEWDSTSISWYVDGEYIWTYNKSTSQNALDNGQWPFDAEFFLIINQSVGNGSWAANADTSHTYETLCDWVRVYQLPEGTSDDDDNNTDSVTVTSISELSNDKAYILYNDHFTTYAIYNPDYSETQLWSAGMTGDSSHSLYSNTYSQSFDATSPNSAWMIVSKNDEWYLYNIGAEKFLRVGHQSFTTALACVFLESTPTPIEITEVDGGFAFRSVTTSDKNYMCAAPQLSAYPISTWTIDDNGSVWQIMETDQVVATPDEVLALIPSYGDLTIDTRNCNIYGESSGGPIPNRVELGQSFSFACHALDGYEPIDGVTVRHGQNLDGPQYVDGERQWSEYTLAVENKELIEIEADSVDGDILLTSYWECTDPEAFQLIFSDEFNTEGQPDDTYWMRTPRRNATWNRWCSDSELVVYQEDGALHCLAIPNPDTSTDDADMLTGGIKSEGKFYFQYGRAEARIKTNQWTGNFPAFWMMPANQPLGWPKDGEIDIWETIDTSTNSWHTIHTNWTYNLGNGGNSQYKTGVDYDLWHVFTLEWDSTSISWYVDGEYVWTYNKSTSQNALDNGQWPFDAPFHLILNQSVGNNAWAANADTSHTYETLFDWVRVYQLPEDMTPVESIRTDDGVSVDNNRSSVIYDLLGGRR